MLAGKPHVVGPVNILNRKMAHYKKKGVFGIVTSSAKGGYVFGSIGLSVCLLVSNITRKVRNGFQ